MIVCIPDVLTREEVKTLRERISSLPFVDGKETAGFRAKLVKNNEQVSKNSEERKTLQNLIVTDLRRSP